MGGRSATSESARFHFAEIGDAECAKVELNNVRTRRFVEARQESGIGDWLESGEFASTEQAGGFAFSGLPSDRRLLGAGIGGGEFERIGAKIITAAEMDG